MTESDPWVAPFQAVLPDFIICGAMKCGTSTVHNILNAHPKIFIPEQEVHFFDMDDHFQHSDFSYSSKEQWVYPQIESEPDVYWKWYGDFFANAAADQLVGEDSTCYISSKNAAERIALQNKPIKTIVCLRQPSKRAYSQYWHMLSSGRAMFNFNDTISFTPDYVLSRSFYKEQLERFFQHISRDNAYIFILEEFLADKEKVLREICEFLAIDFNDIPSDALAMHSNKGKIPFSIRFQTLQNRLFRGSGSGHYMGGLPYHGPEQANVGLFYKLVNKALSLVNPLTTKPPPSMDKKTRRFLDAYFTRELKDLDEIIGKNVSDLWFDD